MIAGLTSFMIGIWLMVSPAILGYGGRPALNDRILGPLIAAFSLISVSEVVSSVRRINIPLGVWLILSPFFLSGYGFIPLWNSIAVGITAAALALVPASGKKPFGGGWRPLFEVDKWTR